MTVHHLPRGRIHVGDWREADLEPGYSLAIVDGPYGMGIAEWDRIKLDDLASWYEPHVARLTSLMAPSASVYLWNTAAGWARIDPVMRGLGWTFRRLIIWDKVITPAMLRDGAFQDTTEVCGLYTRGDPPENGQRETDRTNARGTPCWVGNVWRLSVVAPSYRAERLRHGTEPGRTAWDDERDAPLHPCQKPLAFAERMVRASTRPGDRVLIPFGGTCREAVVIEHMARFEPDEARSYDVCELNQDGRDYIGPALAQIRGEAIRRPGDGQIRMFGGAA